MKFSIKVIYVTKCDFNKCDQIRGKLGISSHLLKKSLMENFIFCVVKWNLAHDVIWWLWIRCLFLDIVIIHSFGQIWSYNLKSS